jgi:uncharacterized membrane protein YkvA (DUF1232 family)
MSDYSVHYSENSFWEKVRDFAIKAGREIIEKVLILYYCLQDPDTPAWAKSVIIGALGYFILPTDAIPDPIPVIGYTDDLGVITAAILAIAASIKEEQKQKARETLAQWFS